nr:hypothetical protein [Chitinophagales bacterium]
MKKLLLLTSFFYALMAYSQAPSVAAPTPTHTTSSNNIKSIFSDAYTNIPVQEWGTSWGPEAATITDNPISGNATKLINIANGKSFAGIDFSPNKFNATTYTHFRVDYYIPGTLPVGQVLVFKLSNHDGPNETNAIEYQVPTIQTGQWVSLDIPLTSFAIAGGGSASRNNIAQIVVGAARANIAGTSLSIYLDNMYFYGPGTTPPPATTCMNTNGEFTTDATGWNTDGGGTVVGGEAYFATSNTTGDPWNTQLAQTGLSLTAGT